MDKIYSMTLDHLKRLFVKLSRLSVILCCTHRRSFFNIFKLKCSLLEKNVKVAYPIIYRDTDRSAIFFFIDTLTIEFFLNFTKA